jgi:hypothetical protein
VQKEEKENKTIGEKYLLIPYHVPTKSSKKKIERPNSRIKS